jgi:hypothetical protein
MIGRTRPHLPRVTAEKQMSARMSQAAPVGDASIPAASAASAFVAAFSWRLLAGGVMIGAEVARMTVSVKKSPSLARGLS